MDEKIEEIMNEYIEALRNPKPFKYTNEEKANILEHLLRMYNTLKITERKNFDNAITLMIENKQKDKTIELLNSKIINLKEDIYELTKITGTYDAISCDDKDDFKFCVGSAKMFEKGFLKKNLISKNKIKEKIKELEEQQEQNRKDLYNAVNTFNFKQIDIISEKISYNMYLEDYLTKNFLEEGE